MAPPISLLMRLLLFVVLSLPASAQSLLGLVPGAPEVGGTPHALVAVDAATGAQTTLGAVTVGGFASPPNQPAPVFVDVARQRAHFVRLFTSGPTAWSLVTADLTTGTETERSWPRPLAMLFGYDAARDRLLSVGVALDTLAAQPLHVRARGVIVSHEPVTGDTVHVATVLRGESVGATYTGESPASLAAPAVATASQLVTVARGDSLGVVASVDLATGVTTFGREVGLGVGIAAYDAAADDVYRTGAEYVRYSDSTWSQRTVLVRDDLDGGGAPDTLATLSRNRRLADDTWTVTAVAHIGDLAVYDALTDRVLVNVDGRLRTVHLATGAVTEGAPVGGVRFVGRSVARPVATATPTGTSPLTLAASPNPAPGAVRLALAGADAARVEAFSVLGRRVAVLHNGPMAADALVWDASGVPAGLYVVRATAADGATATVRVTVAR